MKLRNKLIPIAGVCASIATVAPIALTSCKSPFMVDLTDGNYTPTQGKAVISGYKASLATIEDKYLTDIEKNPEIFVEDYYWSLSKDWSSWCAENKRTLNRLKCKINNCSLTTKTIKYDTKDIKLGLITFNQEMFIDISWETKDKVYYNFQQTFNNQFVNMPIIAVKDDGSKTKYAPNGYYFQLSELYLLALDNADIDWKITTDWTGVKTMYYESGSTGSGFTSTQKHSGTFTTWLEYYNNTFLDLEDYFIPSYYMSDISLSE